MINFETYKQEIGKTLERKYEYYQFLERLKEKYLTGPILYFHIPKFLFRSATCSYLNGCFLSVIPVINAAIEHFLILKNQTLKFSKDMKNGEPLPTNSYLKLNRTPSPKKILKEALANKIINKKLYKEIKDYGKIRNDVIHPGGPGHYTILGMDYTPENKCMEIPEELEDSVGTKPFAEKGIELFLKVLNFNIESVKKGILRY